MKALSARESAIMAAAFRRHVRQHCAISMNDKGW